MSGEDLHKDARSRGCIAMAALCLVVLIMSCALSGVAVQRGIIMPPEIEVSLGSLELFAKTVWNTTCSPISACILTERPIYMVWIVVKLPGNDARSYRLAKLSLEPRK